MGHYTWDSKDLRYKDRIIVVPSSPYIQVILHEIHSSPSAGHFRLLSYTRGSPVTSLSTALVGGCCYIGRALSLWASAALASEKRYLVRPLGP
ncbi:hypothetical protein GW17_00023744 [Ensete ventricosum]|nr:hypothetical protein GW17_00023744 [Ensete ventricosum]